MSKIRKILPKLTSRGTQQHPIGAKVMPKWPQGDQKGAQSGPKASQSDPKVAKKVSEGIPKGPQRVQVKM